MGFDVTYHPITREEMFEWYFEPFSDDSAVDRLAEKYGFLAENYRRFLKDAHDMDVDGATFEQTHGLMLAATQGLFRRYDYFRGSLFTDFVQEHPQYRRYTQSFRETVPPEFRSMEFSDGIVENWCGGIYIPPEAVAPLLRDLEHDADVHQALLKTFGDDEELGRFVELLHYAERNGFGLLEATEVAIPFADSGMSDLENSGFQAKTPSDKPLSLSPLLTEPYDPTRGPHAGKYFLDAEGQFHENPNGDGVSRPFDPVDLDRLRKITENQTDDERKKIVASYRFKPGEHLPFRLRSNFTMEIGCGVFVLLFILLWILSFFPAVGFSWFGAALFAAVLGSLLFGFLSTSWSRCFKTLEIEEHPVRLGKDTKLAFVLQGPFIPGPRNVRRLHVDLVCKEYVVGRKREEMKNREPENNLFRQTIFDAENPLKLKTDPLVFDGMIFRCENLPTLHDRNGFVLWEFVVSCVEASNRRWELVFPIAVVDPER